MDHTPAWVPILGDWSKWTEWYGFIREMAQAGAVWDYIRPDGTKVLSWESLLNSVVEVSYTQYTEAIVKIELILNADRLILACLDGVPLKMVQNLSTPRERLQKLLCYYQEHYLPSIQFSPSQTDDSRCSWPFWPQWRASVIIGTAMERHIVNDALKHRFTNIRACNDKIAIGATCEDYSTVQAIVNCRVDVKNESGASASILMKDCLYIPKADINVCSVSRFKECGLYFSTYPYPDASLYRCTEDGERKMFCQLRRPFGRNSPWVLETGKIDAPSNVMAENVCLNIDIARQKCRPPPRSAHKTR